MKQRESNDAYADKLANMTEEERKKEFEDLDKRKKVVDAKARISRLQGEIAKAAKAMNHVEQHQLIVELRNAQVNPSTLDGSDKAGLLQKGLSNG